MQRTPQLLESISYILHVIGLFLVQNLLCIIREVRKYSLCGKYVTLVQSLLCVVCFSRTYNFLTVVSKNYMLFLSLPFPYKILHLAAESCKMNYTENVFSLTCCVFSAKTCAVRKRHVLLA